jgi:hypothetical protein
MLLRPRRSHVRVFEKQRPSKKSEGAGNAGRQMRTRSFRVKENTRVVTTGSPDDPGTPCANGFNGCFVLSPVIGLSCHRHRRNAQHCRQLDFSVEKSGPHDFAVRFPAHSSRALQASIASRAQRP